MREAEAKADQETPTVYVVDDDPSVRAAIGSVLRSVGLRAAAFASPREFLEKRRPDGPSCLVLDVRLPGSSGLDFQTELLKSGASIPIVFVTGHGDVPMSVQAMKAGAISFLTKPFRDQELLDAVREALERDRMRREEVARRSSLQGRYETLTPREKEVMAMVFAGKTNKEIAAALGTSEITVKVQRGRVMKKMEADSVAALVRMTEELRL